MMIFAIAVCMAWPDGSHNCQLANGRSSDIFHQSELVCDRIVTQMNNNRPQGDNPAIWYECVSKEVPIWKRSGE